MIIDIDEQVLTDSTNLSNLLEEPASDLISATSQSNYENNSFLSALLADSFDLSNFILNYLTSIAQNLQTDCIESSFEFKLLTFLLIVLLTILVAIGIGWKIFGGTIDHFYKRQDYYSKNSSEAEPSIADQKLKTN